LPYLAVRKKCGFGTIFLSCAIGVGIGAAIGLALKNPAAGGTLAAILMVACGMGTSLREIVRNNREKQLKPPS
jgi:hypothetical protein